MTISWNNPKFGKKELELVKQVLESGYVSEGPMTKKLEEELSKICHAKHIIMTTSATAALYLAIEADKRIRDYTEGEVIIPNLTFIATKNAVEMAGLEPIVYDVENETFLGIGERKVKVPSILLLVNLLGRGYKLDSTGDEWTSVICDNAGCLGSNVPNGKVGCYSLQANKLITCGQGGFCATDDEEYAKVIRQIKDFGREDKYDQDTKGFNFKFNDIQAAVVLGQLQQLDVRKKLHLQQYNFYKKALSKYGKFIDFNKGEIPLWVEFFLGDVRKRDNLYTFLKEEGIECRKPWTNLLYDSELYPNSAYYENNCIWLPNGASLTTSQQNKVIRKIKEFFDGI
jgi:perosamine synthetase